MALARKLEQFQRRRGERRQFIAIMEDITATRKSSSQMLEFLSELYNASNRENDYCQTLLKLFDLYCSTGEYAKAAECLDRAAEVDPYESGHLKRLEMLKGKVDDARYRAIAARFTSASKAPEEPAHEEGPTLGASTLQDLMLQAEILVQYGMRNKAVERLQRIQELFPREEERNEDLQRLYMSAGVTPRYAGAAPLPPAAAPAPVAPAAPLAAAPAPWRLGARSGDGCTGVYASGGDFAEAISPGHGPGGAEHGGAGNCDALGSDALHCGDVQGRVVGDGGGRILRRGIEEVEPGIDRGVGGVPAKGGGWARSAGD